MQPSTLGAELSASSIRIRAAYSKMWSTMAAFSALPCTEVAGGGFYGREAEQGLDLGGVSATLAQADGAGVTAAMGPQARDAGDRDDLYDARDAERAVLPGPQLPGMTATGSSAATSISCPACSTPGRSGVLASSGSELALIASDFVYGSVVRRNPSLVSPDASDSQDLLRVADC